MQFFKKFSNFCDSLSASNSKLYLMGDLNLDVLKYSSCPNVTSYVDLLFSYGLLQIITKPTRTSYSATLIDHIITNNSDTLLESYIITTFLSNHFPVFHCIKTELKNSPPPFSYTRDYLKRNISAFNASLLNLDWSSLYV